MDSIRRPSMTRDASIPGQPGPYHHAAAAPTPSPSHPTYGQHFAPPRAVAKPSQPPSHHLAPVAAHPLPSPSHIPQSPHYPAHSYSPQQHGPPPPVATHHPMPNPLAPSYDHHRMAPAAASMTPVRPAMAPTPAAATMPHPGSGTNVYNPPRAPEVYTLPDNMDAAIPPEVRSRFHRDGYGRVLFFTAPSVQRLPENGVAAEYAGLGHSVRYLNGLEAFREERRRKRKERDEAEAESARKKAAVEAQDRDEASRSLLGLTQDSIRDFVEWVDKGNQLLYDNLGDWERKAVAGDEDQETNLRMKNRPAAASI